MEFPNSVNDIEKIVGTREGFFEDLVKEDDWSFVIKLHAFLESICTQLLLFHFKQPELKDIFRRLELSNKTTGKIIFLEKLGFITKENRRFISTLSELRNKLVHDAFNCEFRFNNYLDSLSPDKIKNLSISFSPFEASIRSMIQRRLLDDIPDFEILSKQADINNIISRFKENPKEHIKLGARNVIVAIIDSHYYSDYKQWVQADHYLGTGEVEKLEKEILQDIKERIVSKYKSDSKA